MMKILSGILMQSVSSYLYRMNVNNGLTDTQAENMILWFLCINLHVILCRDLSKH